MQALRGMAWGVALMFASPCLAQIKGEVAPAAGGSLVGETLSVDVNLDFTGSGRLLGSYGAVLSWDPAALQYLNDAGGVQPFNSPVVNRLNVSSGTLMFSDASHDVIRGRLDMVSIEAAFVNLGAVTCLENNSLDTTTAAGTESSNPDTAVPLLNRAFFYLVRPSVGSQFGTYGFTPQCAQERVVDAGDCSP